MNVPLRLFAADYGMVVIERDVLHVARLTPSEVASRSARILAGEAPGEALQPDGEEILLGEIERLEGDLGGRNLDLGGNGGSVSLRFPDRKSRDAALEAIADAAGRPLALRRVRSGGKVLAAYASMLSAVGVAAAAWKAEWVDAAKVAGQGGIALLVLLGFFVRPRRRISLAQKDDL